ncbi:hypothetical protein BDP81DRAFT_185533 [Colletotrichum phormii]|uniref:Uncharacterized protein n=1 Tax=Colletotrichum phormii TaxID=359342 RepID=A0AAI9ZXZ5_9PEZI|nr:uncharacterized protein BDP81DRAFT_185533 [Colletotrichum phormii]KAK1639936.1 hypothetical protein BDP81DRAFT_185533 [Colletotrichum phormii]
MAGGCSHLAEFVPYLKFIRCSGIEEFSDYNREYRGGDHKNPSAFSPYQSSRRLRGSTDSEPAYHSSHPVPQSWGKFTSTCPSQKGIYFSWDPILYYLSSVDTSSPSTHIGRTIWRPCLPVHERRLLKRRSKLNRLPRITSRSRSTSSHSTMARALVLERKESTFTPVAPPDDNGRPQERKMTFWPLIKVVRVFLKSEILSTGIILVDLKSRGRDSIGTRTAVAAKYIEEYARLWVVMPVNRAINDKTARTLMGTNFKQQLKYDGAYSSILPTMANARDPRAPRAKESRSLRVSGPRRLQRGRWRR